jgi:putative transposase
MDRYLDTARGGPLYLSQEPVARLVQASIHYGAHQLKYYDLHAYVIMSNHVHLLVLPREAPSRFLQTLKGYTAREANRLLERTGQPFWQSESFDHWVRDEKQGKRIKAYIENNPVKAGLVTEAKDYLWSSVAEGFGNKAETTLGSAG